MSSTAANADLSKLRINRSGGERSSSEPPRRGRTFLITAVVIALLAIAFFVFRRSFPSAVEVETTTVTRMYPSQMSSLLTATGYVVARQKAAIASKGTGRLVALLVEEGDKVKKDQIIGRLESSDVEAAIAQARANVGVATAGKEQAQAERDDAQKHFTRMTALLAQHTVTTADLEQADARLKRASAMVNSAEASIKAAEANLASMQVQLENTVIRAPFDGTILNKQADVGEIVAPMAASVSSRAAVVTMADMSSLEIDADVSESNLERVTIGNPVEIVLDAIPEKRYHGVVHKIIPTADRAKATVMTKIRFVEFDDRVLPEMSAKIMFLRDTAGTADTASAPVLTVRREALVKRDGKDMAFVLHDTKVELVAVSTGKSFGSLVQVLSGLNANDIVILKPDEKLANGAQVAVKSK